MENHNPPGIFTALTVASFDPRSRKTNNPQAKMVARGIGDHQQPWILLALILPSRKGYDLGEGRGIFQRNNPQVTLAQNLTRII